MLRHILLHHSLPRFKITALEITADQRSKIRKNLIMIGRKARLAIILIGKEIDWTENVTLYWKTFMIGQIFHLIGGKS